MGSSSSTTPSSTSPTTSYIPAIDGLRALAILGIVLFHARPSVLAGGFLGVPVFFAISGFLITRSIERAYARGGFSYRVFVRSRLTRLMPAALATIALTGIVTALAAPNLLAKLHADALPAALLVQNWFYIVRKVPYFAAAGLPSPLTHLWFISVIMQFYLLWPVILGMLARIVRRRRHAVCAIAAGIALSTIAMAVLLGADGDTTRAYYGTDTRAAEFLCGCLCALAHGRFPSRRPQVRAALGWVGLALLLAGFFLITDGGSPLLYRGGYLVAALAATCVLSAVMNRASLMGRALSSPVLVAIGKRSFSLYLVHYPLLIRLNPATRTSGPAWWEIAIQVLAIAILTELLYRFVERPHRVPARPVSNPASNPSPAAAPRAASNRCPPIPSRAALIQRVPRVALAAGMCAVAILSFAPIDWSRFSTAAQQAQTTHAERQQAAAQADLADQSGTTSAAQAKKLKPSAEKVPANLDTSSWTYDSATGTCSADVLMIGDSITEGVAPWIQKILPNAYIDGKVSRQISVGADVYRQDVAAGHGKSVVIVALGSNALIRNKQVVQDIIDAVEGKPLFFVTIRSPYALQDTNNQILRDFAKRNENVGIIDWNGTSAGHDEYLVDDGTHLTNTGCEVYAKMIRKALCGR